MALWVVKALTLSLSFGRLRQVCQSQSCRSHLLLGGEKREQDASKEFRR